MFDLFISYSRSTFAAEAANLQQNLEKSGMKVFLDKLEIDPGANFPTHIAEALLNSRLVLIFADESYFSKIWCVYEFQVAIAPYATSVKAGKTNDLALENLVIALPATGNLNIITAALPPPVKGINWPLIQNLAEVESAVKNKLKIIASSLADKLKACDDATVTALRSGALLPVLLKPANSKAYTPIAPASVKEKFKGRSDTLWEIYNNLEVKSKDEAFRCCIIEGFAGMGKTQLAAEYMWRFAPYTYPQGIIWVSADTDETGLLDQYTHIYGEFSGENEKQFSSLAEAVVSLQQLFKKWGTASKILWVIDNFPETGKTAVIKQLTDYCPVKNYVSLLVTTRQHGTIGADKVITLQALTSEAAIDYLTQPPVERKWMDEDNWHRIVTWVGNLPLALRILHIDLADGFIAPKNLLSKAISSESSVIINEEANALKEEMPPGFIKSIHDALAVSYDRLATDEMLFSAAHLFSRLAARPVMESLLQPFIDTKQLAKLAKRGWLQPAQESNKLERSWTMHKVTGSFLRNKSLEPVAENISLLHWLSSFFDTHDAASRRAVEPHFRMITVRALEVLIKTHDSELEKILEATCLKVATTGFDGDMARGIKFMAADILHRMVSADVLVAAYEKLVSGANQEAVSTMIHALSACNRNQAAVGFVIKCLSDERNQVRWSALVYLPRFLFVNVCTLMIDALMKETNENILRNNEHVFADILQINNEDVLEDFITRTLNYYNQSAHLPHHRLLVSTWCALVEQHGKDFKAGEYTYDHLQSLLWQVAETSHDKEVKRKAIDALAVKDDGSIYTKLLAQLKTETDGVAYRNKLNVLLWYVSALEKPGAPQMTINEEEGSNYISGSLGASGTRRPELITPIVENLFQPASPVFLEITLQELLKESTGKLSLANLVNDKIDAKMQMDFCLSIADAVTSIEPDFSSAYWWKARVLMEKGEFENAFINLSQVITLSPAFADAYWYRGKLNEEFNNKEAAALDLDQYNQLIK